MRGSRERTAARRGPRASWIPSLCAVLLGACSGGAGPDPEPEDAGRPRADAGPRGDAGRPDGGARDGGGRDGGEADAGVGHDAGASRWVMRTEVITDEHRAVPGVAFGGWGPHLGHLLRTDDALFWVDDVCRQDVAGDCDVYVNRRVGVFRRGEAWERVATIPLPATVQQNTGAIAEAGTLRVYGVNVDAGVVTQCAYDVATGASGCGSVPAIATGAAANYVGAALSPHGYRVVWWTNVVDGGGGSFSYIADYGGGFNGPRTGHIGGYNDCAYAHAGFEAGGTGVTFFCQVVSGRAPAWTAETLVGEADLSTADPVSWVLGLGPIDGDPVASTNDLWVDPATNDAHLLARTLGGAFAYYFRASGTSAWGPPRFVEAASFRARFLTDEDVLAVVSGPSSGGLRVRAVERASIVAGEPVDLAAAETTDFALPDDFGAVWAIYPSAAVYQRAPTRLELGVVGATAENVVTYATFSRE